MSNFRKMGIVCLILGAVLMISALLLFMYNQAEDRRAGEAAAAVMPDIREIITAKQVPAETEDIEETKEPEEPEESEQSGDETAAVSEADAAEDEPEPSKMTVEQIAGRGYVGILELPTLGLVLPVLDRCTDGNLTVAPCRYHGSITEENLVIAGHNYKQHFGYLPEIGVGDTVTFTDMDGTVHTYEVGLVETLAATAVEEMNESEWELSLYTCTYSGSERITVRCRRVEE